MRLGLRSGDGEGGRKVKQIARKFLPASAISWLRSLRRNLRRRRWERGMRDDPSARVTREQLVEGFRDLPLDPKKDLIVHSALSKIGVVDGGAPTVIAALREFLDEEATLLMPAYPMESSMLETMRDPNPFDVTHSLSRMGKITEVFRTQPGARRSAHPTHSVVALGPRAEEYVARHHESLSPCGEHSPFRLLAEREGRILCLGTGIGKVTSHHVIEDLVDDYPLAVYLEDLLSKDVVLEDGSTIRVPVRVHDPRLSPLRVDNHAGKEQEILAEMRRRGIVAEGKIGRATAYEFGASGLNEMLRDLLLEGRTIYATKTN